MQIILPPPKINRFEGIRVSASYARNEQFAGQRGTVIWRDPYRKTNEWFYVVHLSACNRYPTFRESDLEPTGTIEREASFFGKEFEISFDLVMKAEMSFVEGTYRLPGKFWEVLIFSFSRHDVQDLRWKSGKWDSGITGTVFTVPRSVILNKEYVLHAMKDAFGHEKWTEVNGPDSMMLR